MTTKDEILNAVKIVNEFAGKPSVGVIADLLKDLEQSANTSTPAKEVRVVEAKETR
jgi:hypothetical protein